MMLDLQIFEQKGKFSNISCFFFFSWGKLKECPPPLLVVDSSPTGGWAPCHSRGIHPHSSSCIFSTSPSTVSRDVYPIPLRTLLHPHHRPQWARRRQPFGFSVRVPRYHWSQASLSTCGRCASGYPGNLDGAQVRSSARGEGWCLGDAGYVKSRDAVPVRVAYPLRREEVEDFTSSLGG
jgi:hypothetical protein